MDNFLKSKAEEIISILSTSPVVKNCTIYGSLRANTHDELSDIDIEVDVSGYDNGCFMLEINEFLKGKLNIFYSDYAPSLVPDKYIVSIAIDESNPFLIVDLCCVANPHCTNVTKEQMMAKNDSFAHILKLWTANVKHYVRGKDCYDDIARMARKLKIDIDAKSEEELLEEVLCWLEGNVSEGLKTFVKACRDRFDILV